jgi:hypothetical protein
MLIQFKCAIVRIFVRQLSGLWPVNNCRVCLQAWCCYSMSRTCNDSMNPINLTSRRACLRNSGKPISKGSYWVRCLLSLRTHNSSTSISVASPLLSAFVGICTHFPWPIPILDLELRTCSVQSQHDKYYLHHSGCTYALWMNAGTKLGCCHYLAHTF